MAEFLLIPNDPLLAHRCDDLAKRLREAGFEVTVEKGREERSAGVGAGEAILISVISSATWDAIKNIVAPMLKEWFTEQPRQRDRMLRVRIFEGSELVDELSLKD